MNKNIENYLEDGKLKQCNICLFKDDLQEYVNSLLKEIDDKDDKIYELEDEISQLKDENYTLRYGYDGDIDDYVDGVIGELRGRRL